MLIRASGNLIGRLYLVALNDCCVYAVGDASGFTLIDCGPSAYFDLLSTRLAAIGLPIERLKRIFLTNLHAERVGALPAIKAAAPGASVMGSAKFIKALAREETVREIYESDQALSAQIAAHRQIAPPKPMEFSDYRDLLRVNTPVSDVETVTLVPDVNMRIIPFPVHYEDSRAYYLTPYNYLIVDEGLGYFRGREFAAPGADYDLLGCVQHFDRLKNIELAGICFPNMGAISGTLVTRHLQAIRQNSEDLVAEAKKALAAGLSQEEILNAIRESFYVTESKDPVLRHNLQQSLSRVWQQVLSANSLSD